MGLNALFVVVESLFYLYNRNILLADSKFFSLVLNRFVITFDNVSTVYVINACANDREPESTGTIFLLLGMPVTSLLTSYSMI